MSVSKIHPHHGYVEDILRLDFAILSFLREKILSGYLGFVSLQDAYEQGFFSHIDGDWGRFRKRVFYQVGLGYVDVSPVFAQEGDIETLPVDYELGDVSIPPLRLSPTGFLHIDELEYALKRYDGWNRYITPWRDMFRDMRKYKWTLAISLTGMIMLIAIISGIPASTFIANIPLAGSVIDTRATARFDAAREQDGFYRALLSGVAPWSITRSEVLLLSESERIFRISFDKGHVREVYVRKEGNVYHVMVLHDAP